MRHEHLQSDSLWEVRIQQCCGSDAILFLGLKRSIGICWSEKLAIQMTVVVLKGLEWEMDREWELECWFWTGSELVLLWWQGLGKAGLQQSKWSNMENGSWRTNWSCHLKPIWVSISPIPMWWVWPSPSEIVVPTESANLTAHLLCPPVLYPLCQTDSWQHILKPGSRTNLD